MTDTKPTKFEDLDAPELYRSAIEDFAVPVEEADKGKKKVLLAALLESGIEWKDYVAQHPEFAEEPKVETVVAETPNVLDREPEPQRAGAVITSGDVSKDSSAALSVEAEPVIHVAQPPRPQVSDKYLIKMVRDNELFEVPGVRFTKSHPYALVGESLANHLLEKEEGFRMATPSELREFYG